MISLVNATCGILVSGQTSAGSCGDNWTISGNSFYRSVTNSLNDGQIIVINFIPSPLSSVIQQNNIIFEQLHRRQR